MAQNRSASERDIIRDFTNRAENTMNQVVSCSVGTALLLLRDKYIDNPTDETSVADFCQRNIKELEELAKTIENSSFKSAIEFIIRKTNEPIHSLFDKVTLYFPSLDANSSNLRSEEYLFSLKEVLALVWTAISDNNAYLYHYAGTRKEQLELAQNDFTERSNGLFRCLVRMQDESICHHGNRNEMVFLLNGTHEDIHLLEDGKMAVLLYLKEKIAEKVQRALASMSNDDPTRKLISIAFIEWMSESKASTLLAQIDPENTIKKGLFDLFVHHGVSPQNIKLDVMINEALNYLEFYGNPNDYPGLTKVGELLKEIENAKQPARSATLLRMQGWLKNAYSFNSADDIKVTHFHKIYFLHKSFLKLRDLLIVTGQMSTSDCEQYPDRLISYLDRLSTNQDTVSVSTEEQCDIDSLLDKLCNTEFDPIHDTIENFFVRWFSAYAEFALPVLSQLYGLLLNDTAKKKILLTDEDIQKFHSTRTNEDVLDITPYMINRIFLHAILIAPENWSDDFVTLFNRALQFVENGFNLNDASDITSQLLMRDSYPEKLMRQLNYLKLKQTNALGNSNPVVRPNRMILLPAHAKNCIEWSEIFSLLPKNRIEEIVQTYFVSIRRTITSRLELTGFFRALPNEHHRYCIINFGYDFIATVIKEIDDLMLFLTLLSPDAQLALIDVFGDKISEITIKDLYDFFLCLSFFNSLDIRTTLFNQFKGQLNRLFPNGKLFNDSLNKFHALTRIGLIVLFGETIKNVFENGSELGRCLALLLEESRMTLINALGDKIGTIIHNDDELVYCLGLIPQKNRMELFNLAGNDIWHSSKTVTRFVDCLKLFSVSDRLVVINNIGTDIKFFIKNYTGLVACFAGLNKAEQVQMLRYFPDINKIFMHIHQLKAFLHVLSRKACALFIDLLGHDILNKIFTSKNAYVDINDLNSCLATLSKEGQIKFLTALGTNIRAIITDSEQLGRCLTYLEVEVWPLLINNFYDKLQDIFNGSNTLPKCLVLLNENTRISLIKALRDKIKLIGMDAKRFGKVLAILPYEDWPVFINVIGENNITKYIKDHSQLAVCLNRLPDNYLTKFIEEFGNKIDHVIEPSDNFNLCLFRLDADKRLAFIRAFRHKAKSVLNTVVDVSNCLHLFPQNRWRELIQILGKKFFDIFTNGIVLSQCLQNLSSYHEIGGQNLITTLNYNICDIIKHPDELNCFVMSNGALTIFSSLNEVYYKFKPEIFDVLSLDDEYNSLTYVQQHLLQRIVSNFITHNPYLDYLDYHIFRVFSDEIDRLKGLGDEGKHKANLLMIENLKLQRIVFDAILEEMLKFKVISIDVLKFDPISVQSKVHPVLIEKIKALTNMDFIHHERNPVAAFFKKILAALLAIPLLGIPFHSKHYHRFFFETTSAKAMRKINHDLKGPERLVI